MSPINVHDDTGKLGAPRVSGDEPYSDPANWETTECSPRERG